MPPFLVPFPVLAQRRVYHQSASAEVYRTGAETATVYT